MERGLGLKVQGLGFRGQLKRVLSLDMDSDFRVQAGGFGRFHKNIAARPPFWRQSLAPNCQSLAPNCQSLEQKSGVFGAHSRFSPPLFCAALWLAKKSGDKVFSRDHGGRGGKNLQKYSKYPKKRPRGLGNGKKMPRPPRPPPPKRQ